ncbi:LCP family protein [Faecalibaculum rodentium]|uniref:LCP family protein n=1 Tax=Faecalibaculum rodentium TaxID=1702221 RepID=UPI0023F4384B|nr:LCP family protein [Faecalibaculum rodentium]
MKWIKSEKFWQIFLGVTLIILTGLLIWQLYSLDILPQNIQVPTIIALVLIVLILILIELEFGYKSKVRIATLVLSILLCIVYGLGAYYVFRTNGTLTAITAIRHLNENKVSLIALQESDIHSLDNLGGKRVGNLKSIDREGTDKALKEISGKTNAGYETVEFDSVPQEVTALYNEDVDAIILNEAYRTNVVDLEEYADFSSRTRVVETVTFTTTSTNEALAVSDVTTKPYNILISGNDSYGDVGELSRSDVNMIVTVNPMTSTVLLTSIPRDSYVAVDCGDAYACAEGQMDKITHTGINGITSTKRTVEKLLNIDINYTFRVNFSSVTSIVDSIGGIDVDVPEGQAVETFYADSTLEGVTEGWNHLNGERALSFARERYAYIDGDNQRVRNQQMVLKAIFDKATSPDIIINYTSLLNVLENAFDTTLSRDEITDFIKYQIQAMPGWKFETYQLSGEGSILFCPSLGQEAYVTILDQSTVALAHDKIRAVLEGRDADEVMVPESNDISINQYAPDLSGEGADNGIDYSNMEEPYYYENLQDENTPLYDENGELYEPDYSPEDFVEAPGEE